MASSPGVLAAHESSLEEYFQKHPPRSAKQARAIIEQQTGIRRGLTQVRHFLKGQLGLRWRKTGAIPVPPKETVEEHARKQAAFVREEAGARWSRPVGPPAGLLRGRRPLRLAPFLGCLWCAARLFVRAASGRKRYNVLGALDAVTHRMIRVTNDGYINAETVCALLLRGGGGFAVGLPITLVLDNARYQKCALVQGLAASLGIELLYLPGYSPNLNLIERLWRFVRKQSLDSTYDEDFTQFRTAIDGCLDGLSTVHKGEMDTLLTHKFQMFEDVPLLAA